MMTLVNMHKTYKDKILNFLILFSCFSIAMPTAWLSISTSLLLMAWIISGNWRNFHLMKDNPAVITVLLFLLAYLASVFYATTSWKESFHYLFKYAKLLLIPIVVTSVYSKKIRAYAIYAFLTSIFLTLTISYFNWLHLIPNNLNLFTIDSPTQGFIVYKNRITQSILLAFAMYMMLCKAFDSNDYKKWIWSFLAFLCFFNIFHLINGRSGQLIALCLILFFLFKKFGKDFLKYGFLVCVVCFTFKSQVMPYAPERLVSIYTEIQEHSSESNLTSSGIRMEMYKNTLALIQRSPLIGHGVGSLRLEYNELVKSQDTLLKDVTNPHNQYLMILFDTGLIGGALFFLMLYYFWQSANRIKKTSEPLLGDYTQGLILTFALGCFFNSLLMDAGEGRFFCLMAGLFLSAYSPRKPSKK
jgi:O-antigen ligase